LNRNPSGSSAVDGGAAAVLAWTAVAGGEVVAAAPACGGVTAGLVAGAVVAVDPAVAAIGGLVAVSAGCETLVAAGKAGDSAAGELQAMATRTTAIRLSATNGYLNRR
jgi:hypothetical protein